MCSKYFIIGLVFYLYYQINRCSSERIPYFSTEHPMVNFYDVKVLKNFTMLSKRLGRQDPKYYVELYIHSLVTADNNITTDFYFYQLLTNRYKPSFVEMHFKFCDMINSDTFFGQTMRDAIGGRRCPYPPLGRDSRNYSCMENLVLQDGDLVKKIVKFKNYFDGVYVLKNLSIPYVPKGFPFPKGRIYCNASLTERGVTKLIFYGSIDLEIKERRINKN